ncbi:MAG: substrate-binding domain-containing protein [Verrucomicrobiae bacterium]|nr:substrate-binding domain-containing protein [Verrucomicrobiae bacterium]
MKNFDFDWLRQKGVSVPGEMAIVGFDNLQAQRGTGRFSTTKPDFTMMGERAARMLLERIGTRNMEPTELVLPCPLLTPEDEVFYRSGKNDLIGTPAGTAVS